MENSTALLDQARNELLVQLASNPAHLRDCYVFYFRNCRRCRHRTSRPLPGFFIQCSFQYHKATIHPLDWRNYHENSMFWHCAALSF